MKTRVFTCIAACLFLSNASQAQITEGKLLLGGAFSFYNATNQNSSSVYTNLQFGKAIKDNTVIGVIGSIAASNNNTGSRKYQVNSYSAGIFYRKYKPLANNLYFFGELDASYQHSKNTYTYFIDADQNLMTTSNGVAVGFIPGISYSVFKRMQMELTMPNIANISYTGVKTIAGYLPPSVPEQKANNFSANVSLNSNLLSNFGIGFKFLLGK